MQQQSGGCENPSDHYRLLNGEEDKEEERRLGVSDDAFDTKKPGEVSSADQVTEDEARAASAAASAAAKQRCVLKGLYFIQTGAAAGLQKFLPVYLEQAVKLSPTEIGTMLVAGQITNFFGGLFWGRAADVTGKYKITSRLFFPSLLISPTPSPSPRVPKTRSIPLLLPNLHIHHASSVKRTNERTNE